MIYNFKFVKEFIILEFMTFMFYTRESMIRNSIYFAGFLALKFAVESVFVSTAASINESLAFAFSGVVVELPFYCLAMTNFRSELKFCCGSKKTDFNIESNKF